jgi:hypothetical protein
MLPLACIAGVGKPASGLPAVHLQLASVEIHFTFREKRNYLVSVSRFS